MNRLLIVANDSAASEMIGAQLEHMGNFRTAVATSVAEAIERARSNRTQFDAVLLITGRSDESPASLCARLRQALLSVPIVILAQQASENDVVDGPAGASDFVVAPYRPVELQARLRAQIRAQRQQRRRGHGPRPLPLPARQPRAGAHRPWRDPPDAEGDSRSSNRLPRRRPVGGAPDPLREVQLPPRRRRITPWSRTSTACAGRSRPIPRVRASWSTRMAATRRSRCRPRPWAPVGSPLAS